MGKRVLVVEDDEFIGEVIATSLDEQGYDVDVVSSGQKIWQYLKRRRPSLILLDLALPQEDGISICRKLRKTSVTAKVPIIIVSAMSQPRNVRAAIEAGANDFIKKPFDIDELVTAAATYASQQIRAANPLPMGLLGSTGQAI
ncbi:MAG: response regulator transcription factor [Chloroflexi bacterium]|nr:response regulator transcription factor [Chloroflexota bacterium]MDA8188600.1 response regulator transcription factor [Dehalococcoidales bacterium]